MDEELSRRTLLRFGLVGAGALTLPGVLSACGSSGHSAITATTNPPSTTDPVVDAARREGRLNLIAVDGSPHSPYRHALDGFRRQSGLTIDLASPSAGSGIEMNDVREKKGKADQPDVVDVGLSEALAGAKAGLFATTRPIGWEEIPSAAKDPDGAWLSTYYALIGIASNPAKLGDNPVPTNFDDLEKLTGGVTVGFPGDPRTSDAAGPLASASAFGAVWSAALARKGSLDDIGPGIDYFKQLTGDKIFVPSQLAIAQTLANQTISVGFLLNSDFERSRGFVEKGAGSTSSEFRLPLSAALYPNYFAQAAVNGSPHPDAAKLWLRYLISDDGGKALLQGGLVPTRFPAMVHNDEVRSADLAAFTGYGIELDRLTNRLASVQIPSVDQVKRAQDEVNKRWGPEVRGRTS